MAGFGGAVKLTGEAEYRAALTRITQNLREVSSELKVVSSEYGRNDSSQEANAAKSQVLNERLTQQKAKLEALRSQYRAMGAQYATQAEKHTQLAAKLEQEKRKLTQIEATLGKTSPEYEAQAKVVADLARDVDRSSSAMAANDRAMSNMRVKMNNAQADINKTGNEMRQLGGELEKAGESADEAGGKTKGMGDDVEAAGSKAEKASAGYTTLKNVLANLASNVIQTCVSGIRNLASEAISSSDALKKFESTMRFSGYNGSQIRAARDAMKDYADKTVYDLSTVANTTAQLASNGVPNFERLTEAAGNLNAVAGGNADTFNSVSMVLTQTAGAGKLTTENWNQLANAIPGASGRIQEALLKNGAYTGNFRDAMEKGQVSAAEFNRAIMSLGFTDAAQKAATSTSTFEGAMGNMKAAVVDGLMQVYDAIGSENVTNFINGVSQAVGKVIPPIKQAVEWLKDNLPTIAPMLAVLAAGYGGLMIGEKIQRVVEAFKLWKEATEAETAAQLLLNIAQDASPIGLVIGLVAALAAGIAYLWQTNSGFRDFVTGAWNSIKTGIGNACQAIANFFTVTVPSALQRMLGWFQGLPGRVGGFLSGVVSRVSGWVSDMGNRARSAGSQFVQSVVNFFSQLPGRVGGFLSGVIGHVASWAGQLGSRGARAARSLFDNVVNTLRDLPGKMADIGKNLVKGVWNGITNAVGWITDKIRSFGGAVTKAVKRAFGINSPSRVMRDEVGVYIAQGIGVGFESEMGAVTREMQAALPDAAAFRRGYSVGVSVDGSGYGSQPTRQNMVEAFTEALRNVRVVLDDEVAGRFVTKTVTAAIYR